MPSAEWTESQRDASSSCYLPHKHPADRWPRCDSEVYTALADHNTSTLTETPRPGSQAGSEPNPRLSLERTESHQNFVCSDSNTTHTHKHPLNIKLQVAVGEISTFLSID